MVDPIGAKPVAQDRSLAAVAKTAPVDRSRSVVQNEAEAAPSGRLAGLVAEFAAKPPVDAERVARIRHAIANNSYPILPETVADRLIAIRLNWKPE